MTVKMAARRDQVAPEGLWYTGMIDRLIVASERERERQ